MARRDQKQAMERVPFTKMQGLGNDFMVIDRISYRIDLTGNQVRRLADRHFGVGFDQLLMIEPPSRPDVDFDYRIFNADGSEVEHCGNGARCFARYVLDRGLVVSSPILVRTCNRTLSLQEHSDNQISVDMGVPDFRPASLPLEPAEPATDEGDIARHALNVDGRNVEFRALSMGNPHIVLSVDDVEQAPVNTLGPALCRHPAFPQGVNVGFMRKLDRSTIRLRVFERGVGETIACGTGACAAAVAGMAAGELENQVTVRLGGGELRINWQGDDSPVIMTGPAVTVYEGTVLSGAYR